MATKTYTANQHIRMGDKSYAPGDVLQLDDETAKLAGTAVQLGGKAAKQADAEGSGGGDAGGGAGGSALDPALFTPAALKKAGDLGIADMGRTRKTAADGAKWGVEDVERRHEKQGDDDE